MCFCKVPIFITLSLVMFACGGAKNASNNTEDTNSEDSIVSTGSVRFVVLGDAGVGDEMQYTVADAIETICAEKGCDFALYLGDNFYEVGVEGVDDTQFVDKFENPYSNLDFPFYAVLGNHDYGGLGHDQEKAEPQVEYTEFSDKWWMPDRYYSHTQEHIAFVGLDTNAILWNDQWGGVEAQAQWVQDELESAHTLWKIAYGHHPYISNGEHGVAGQYDGLENVPIASGTDFKVFVEDNLCGKVDIYFSGHDHDMQWLEPQCGVEFIVSGAGAKQRARQGWDVPTKFEQFNDNGFLWVEIADNQLFGQFYDSQAQLLYAEEITKE